MDQKIKLESWKELSRSLVYDNPYWKIEKVKFHAPDDRVIDFFIKKEDPIVLILALTPDKEVILTRQYRQGPKRILYDLPGGFIFPKKDHTRSAEKELLEETGYAGKIEFIGTTFKDAFSTRVAYCFIATDCKKASSQSLDPNEYINVELLSLDEFRELLRSGQMSDIDVGYMCLDHLGLL